MALIKCPECGRENVSDSAAACPGCGFGIKDYFEKQKEEKIEKIKQVEVVTQSPDVSDNIFEADLKPSPLIDSNTDEDYDIEEKKQIAREITLKKRKGLYGYLAVFGIFSIIFAGFIVFDIINDNRSDDYVFIIACICGVMFLSGILNYVETVKDLKWINTDFKKYEEVIAKRKKLDEEIKEEKRRRRITPPCPNCGSKNTSRISTASRAVSVGTVGLASSKIGKQYQCNTCKHMW